jgi:alkylation response protein AidB-like acyl-CoA dehydrogenase
MFEQKSQWYKLQYPECFVNEEMRMMQKTLADFVDKEIMPVRSKIDDDPTHEKIITPILKKLQAGLGYQKNMIPKAYGGNEALSMVGAALRQEQLSRADYGISLHSACTEWGWTPAAQAYFSPSPTGNAWAKAVYKQFAPKFIGDELAIACFNFAEVESACDIENPENEGRTVRVKAELKGDEWVLNGNKFWATNSGEADLHCVVCNMDPRKGIDGFALVYVPDPWKGISHGTWEVKCGVIADSNTSTYFDNVRVPKEWGIQGPEAWKIFLNTVSAPMSLNAANAVGCMQGAFDVLMDYCKQRIVGGKPLCQHLHAALILGEMASIITVGRAAFLETAYEYDHTDIYGTWDTDAMMAKGHAVHAYLTRVAPDIISRGMELMGSFGYVRENHYEKYYRDVAVVKLVLGGSHLGYFDVCKQFYDLEYSSFGPGKLKMPCEHKKD